MRLIHCVFHKNETLGPMVCVMRELPVRYEQDKAPTCLRCIVRASRPDAAYRGLEATGWVIRQATIA